MRWWVATSICLLLSCSHEPIRDESSLRAAIASGREVRLPRGVIDVSTEIILPVSIVISGSGPDSVLRAASTFRGRALLRSERSTRLVLRDFAVDGNRSALEHRTGLPPYDRPFSQFTLNNGILIENAVAARISGLRFQEISGFAILASGSRNVVIDRIVVESSGSRNASGRNNTTGGVLLEEGTTNFQVMSSTFKDIRGNAVWTHSLYMSPRNSKGLISGNRFERIARDAIQVGHATGVLVNNNTGREIGFPASEVDIEGRAYPVAIDTAGDVDSSEYKDNSFREINGKCIDLDGFHHGNVSGNSCVNTLPPEQFPHGNYGIVMNNTNPDMQSEAIRIENNTIDGPHFGGIFVIGSRNWVVGNTLRNLNRAHCNEEAVRFGCYHAPGEPDMLRSGIYLGKGAERPAPARNNAIQSNRITGFKMKTRCIAAAPGVALAANRIVANQCED